MLTDAFASSLFYGDIALIITSLILLFWRTSPVVEFGYIARFISGALSMILSTFLAFNMSNGISVYGAAQPMQDSGAYWMLLLFFAGFMFLYSVPAQIVMYIIERTGWLVAPVDEEIAKAKRAIRNDTPAYSREEILGTDEVL
jgi:membrane protein insertase Oxa1/YidC/SpoIIIJ